ncbi:hypothetical protein CYLTODRAFT_417988 [Cylindrobasidium torrendii FP15055 ss-10]|uniref:TOM13-domain-containing protein n=1 Tax=Cylindrobasidium torrendii FP15055 ss-10 TaxID=1314674 RepID=A0A0D7BQ92_9AGAR|nr:hypothetical protein CYLTODRAFT_417988 [Cylindrobasidium torrendii FP15055 ss-10]
MSEGTPFNAADESLLEAALSQSFSVSPQQAEALLPKDTPATHESLVETSKADAPSAPPLVSSEDMESWKSEYDEQLEHWKAESAVAREKAEKERKKWADIRATEPKEDYSGWENVKQSVSVTASPPTTSIADARDLITGEAEKPSAPPSNGDSGKWEDVHSNLSSSFPSMNFPDADDDNDEPQASSRKPPAAAPTSVTLAAFDSSLSTRTRVKALLSSLAINLLLPFVNGVMLGFGEIFAKNVVLAWWRPGSSVAQTGIRKRRL